MVVATRIDSFLAPPITHASLYDAVKVAMANAGFGIPFDEYTIDTTYKIAVYEHVSDATKTYGKNYIKFWVRSDLYVFQSILATWNSATNTGTAECSEYYISQFNTTAPVNFTSLNALPEHGMVVMTQQTNYFYLGMIVPENRPAWWDLNYWPYFFMFVGGHFEIFRSCSSSPYNHTENSTSLNHGYMAYANLITNRRDLIPGILLYNQSARGISGKTSDDLVMVAANGSNRFDTVQIPGDTKEYLLVHSNSGALAVRTK